MNVDEPQLRVPPFKSKRGNELYPALLKMLDRDALMWWP